MLGILLSSFFTVKLFFKCRFLQLDKWDYPENSQVVFCPDKQRSLELFYVVGFCFRTLAVILV